MPSISKLLIVPRLCVQVASGFLGFEAQIKKLSSVGFEDQTNKLWYMTSGFTRQAKPKYTTCLVFVPCLALLCVHQATFPCYSTYHANRHWSFCVYSSSNQDFVPPLGAMWLQTCRTCSSLTMSPTKSHPTSACTCYKRWCKTTRSKEIKPQGDTRYN